ncbi:unnamed protein product, partial [Symbiodinium natans]
VLSRLAGGVGDCQGDALSPEDFQESVQESPVAFGAFKLCSGAVCRKWKSGLLVDGLASLHRSAAGPGALGATLAFANEQGAHFVACLAVLDAVQWWSEVGMFSVIDLDLAANQLRRGCEAKGLDSEELARDLRRLSETYVFRHVVMLRWI